MNNLRCLSICSITYIMSRLDIGLTSWPFRNLPSCLRLPMLPCIPHPFSLRLASCCLRIHDLPAYLRPRGVLPWCLVFLCVGSSSKIKLFVYSPRNDQRKRPHTRRCFSQLMVTAKCNPRPTKRNLCREGTLSKVRGSLASWKLTYGVIWCRGQTHARLSLSNPNTLKTIWSHSWQAHIT